MIWVSRRLLLHVRIFNKNVPSVKHEIIQRLCKMNLELFLYENSKNSIKSEVPPEEVKKKATVHLSLPLSLSHLMTNDNIISISEKF